MSLDELLPWLFRRTSGEIRWGLERTEHLLAILGDPHRCFRSIHIGGTNGKGSVAALTDSVIRRQRGRRVGLYTSPHLVEFTERIRIDGVPVDESLLLRLAERLRPEIERSGATFFEATTALAFGCFAEAAVEVAVVEVGLGGRLDATNVLSPMAAAITNIDREHTDLLGESLAAIAREKAGILKPGVPAITAERRPEVQRALREAARQQGASVSLLDDIATVLDAEVGVKGTRFRIASRSWGPQELWIPLPGSFQARNALLAAELLALLTPDFSPTLEELREGFASAAWPGRLQIARNRGTTWLFDVAHNPSGVEALSEALELLELPAPRVLVCGILADKPWNEMLPPLLRYADASILTIPSSAPDARRWNPTEAASRLVPEFPKLRVIADLCSALDRAVTMAPHGTVIVTGSIHTVGDAMAHIGIPPVAALAR